MVKGCCFILRGNAECFCSMLRAQGRESTLHGAKMVKTCNCALIRTHKTKQTVKSHLNSDLQLMCIRTSLSLIFVSIIHYYKAFIMGIIPSKKEAVQQIPQLTTDVSLSQWWGKAQL